MKKRIFVAWDYNKEEYVWATNPHDLKVKSPTWGDCYHEVFISEQQLETLQNGGWIYAVTRNGVRVKS